MPSEGLFTAAPPSLSDQDLSVLRVDASGNLKVTSAGGGGEAITAPLGSATTTANAVAIVPATGALFTVNAGINSVSSLWGSVNNVAVATGGVALFSRIPSCAATTNLTGVKSTPGRVYKILATNTTAAAIYIKFYNNVSGAVVVGTSTVFMSRTIPANSTASYDFMDIGAFFGVGITYALTTGPLDSDATAVTAGAVVQLEVAFA